MSPRRSCGTSALDFYIDALTCLDEGSIPYLMGGAFAYSWYAKLGRETKDLDVFVRREDLPRALDLFRALGCRTELPFPHWLGKVHAHTHSMDLIFSSGNGVTRVDDLWFAHAVPANVLGRSMRLCPAEEMIWSKAYVQERERFDGADVVHLFREMGPRLDWDRLLTRFGDHWRVLLAHIVLFGFVYPDQRHQIPTWVVASLTRRLAEEKSDPDHRVCYGTLLSREQYLWDVEHLGYADSRVEPHGRMSRAETDIWTAAIDDGKRDG